MSKIKLIVEIDEDDYKAICSDKGYSYANTMWWIIRNGTPYNPTGDLISREALKFDKNNDKCNKCMKQSKGALLFCEAAGCCKYNYDKESDNETDN